MPWRERLRALAAADGRQATAVPRPDRGPDGEPGRADIEAVLARPDQISMEFQPILDVRAARTAGWEVLARFDGRATPSPDRWFAAAYRAGLGTALEAVTVRRALSALRMRTAGTFMSVNVSAAALDDPAVVEAIAGSAPLTGLVVELTEHTVPPTPGPWTAACHRLRDLGAVVAIDDLGTGYAEILQILQIEPQIIKIDKVLVAALQDDPARRAMLRFLGLFADEVDAWLLAEGVETTAQLQALQALGVPLAQGWLVGLPDPVPQPCRAEVTAACAAVAPPPPWSVPGHAAGTTVAAVMRPPAPGSTWSSAALRVPVDLSLAEAGRRALTRPATRRYAPLQCIGPDGRLVGELAVHDLLLAVLDRYAPPSS